MEGTTNHPRAPLQLLPNELLSLIFHDGELTKDDMKNMRLVGREFRRAANEILFRSIRISRLCKDRDIFVRSCDDPSIADYVKEVIWDELGWDQTIFPELSRPMAARNIPLWPHQLTTGQRALLDIESKEMFWFPVADPTFLYLGRTTDTDVADRRKLAVDRFGPTFQACIDKLPKLHTFTSRPINPKRLRGTLTPIPNDLTIRQIRRSSLEFRWGAWKKDPVGELFDELDHFYTTRHQDGQAILPRNDGLFMFLLPAMDRPTSKVRHLNWVDEYPGFSHVRPFPPESLKQLESLKACFLADHSSCCSVLEAGSNQDSLIKALAHATELQDVQLCCHHDGVWLFPQGRFNVCPIERNLAEALSELNLPLRTLHLSGIQARKPNVGGWVSVIKNHTETLQEVFIDVEERSMPRHQRDRAELWKDLNALPGWTIPESQVCGLQSHRDCMLERCSNTAKASGYKPYKITMTKQHA